MSLLNAIYSASSGIAAAQAKIDVASRNIASASVEGYTRGWPRGPGPGRAGYP
jgi:flagellar hook-associated protein 1